MAIKLDPALVSRLPAGQSPFTFIMRRLKAKDRKTFERSLSKLEWRLLEENWDLWARPEQRPPITFLHGEKTTWVILGGRGMGKTRVGGQQVIEWARTLKQDYGDGHIALVAKDPADSRDVMIEGKESGILAISPFGFRPTWEPTKRLLTWPNGVTAHTYSSETPDDLRGPQHHKAWGDEPAKWKYAQETWDNLQFGLRLGATPQTILTGTPRPTKMLISILHDKDTVVTRGSTDDNKDNLTHVFIKGIYRKYEGTRLGRQELNAELLQDTPGALWTLDQIEALRVKECPELEQIVIAIDPGVTDPKGDPELIDEVAETGIVAVGKGIDGHGYVLHDLSGSFSPDTWAKRAVTHYDTLKAERIVGEVNNGGDLVEAVIRSAAKDLGVRDVVYKKVHASRGKLTRAEPVSALYEQKRFHHVGSFPELEDQMTTWVPGMKSPDRMDALVWGATEAILHALDELVF